MTTTELVKENERLKAALEKCREVIIDGIKRLDAWGPAPVDAFWIKEAHEVIALIDHTPNPQPTQDPATSTSFQSGWRRGMMDALDMIQKGVSLEMAVGSFKPENDPATANETKT